jgi:hypothetical protein
MAARSGSPSLAVRLPITCCRNPVTRPLTITPASRLHAMPRIACCLATVALALTALHACAQNVPAQAAPVSATLPIVDCDGLPCINLTFPGGIHGRFAVDTGGPSSVIDLAFAKSLHADVQPYVGRDGKTYPGYFAAKISNAHFGALDLGDLKFLAVDMAKGMSGQDTLHLDGTLGLPALANRLLTLDYPARSVTLSAPLTAPAACPGNCGTLADITFGKQGPPILVATSGFSVNGKPISVQVDLMYSGSLVIYDASIDKLGFTDVAKSCSVKQHFAHTDGGVDMLQATATTQSFGKQVLLSNGPLYFPLPGVHQPDGLFDGTIGAAALGNSRLTLDLFDHQMWIS